MRGCVVSVLVGDGDVSVVGEVALVWSSPGDGGAGSTANLTP